MSELNEEDRTELVAYLDGELGEEAAMAFEARLSRDRKLRAEADALKKTWEMLDYLPRAEPSPSFTNQTLERLAVNTTGRQHLPRRWLWGGAAGWAAAVLVALLGGLFVAHVLWPGATPAPETVANQKPDVEAVIVRDMDVIRNFRLYQNADDLSFVRGLPDALGDDEDDL